MDLSLISYLSFLVAFQLLFVGLFLVSHKKGNRRNNSLLGAIFIMIAWNMADLTLQMNSVILKWRFLQSLDDGFLLLYGPMLYLYTRGVVFRDFKLSVRNLLHLIPYTFLTLLVLIVRDSGSDPTEKIIQNGFSWQFYFVSGLMYAHVFLYLLLSYQLLRSYRLIIRSQYSQIDQMNLDWLSSMLGTFGAITFMSLVHHLMPLMQNRYVFMITLVLLLIFVFFFVNRVILKALQQPEIFAGIGQEETLKYLGSNLTSEQLHEYKEKLLSLLENEKPFLNPELSLTDLSQKLSVSSKSLSQVINQSFDRNFFDFINAYRIKEVQQTLKESKDSKLTILEVMYQAGFNSKSSFNAAFKKETGHTPTEFRKSL